jgi:hypothetical protein
MCIRAAYETTLANLKLELTNVIVGAIALTLGYLLFRFKRGKKHANKKAIDDGLWIFAPLGIVVVCVFAFNIVRSPHLVYRVEHDKAQELINKAEARANAAEQEKQRLAAELERTKPDLRPEIYNLGSGPAGKGGKDVLVLVLGTIRNLGASGSVDKFWLDLRVGDRLLGGEFPVPPAPKLKLMFGKTKEGRQITFSGQDYWTRTARAQLIAKDFSADGWIMAVFRGVTQKEVYDRMATVILTCSDMTGKKSSAEFSFRPGPNSDLLFMEDIQEHRPKH